MSLLLTGTDWEKINKKMGVDVLDIVVNLDGRYTSGQQADLIVKRCNLTAIAQLAHIRNSEKFREKAQHLFCQHCRAIQKVMNVEAKCWYNLLDREAPAFCASNEDFITAILALLEEKE